MHQPTRSTGRKAVHLLLQGWLALFFVAQAQANPLHISLVPRFPGDTCLNAVVRNLTSNTLQVTLNYTVRGTDGSYASSSQSIGGTTFNGGENTGYYMTGLGPGQSTTVGVNNPAAVRCNVDQSVEYSYTTYNVDAHNQRVGSNESAERRALGAMIGNWNDKEAQRKQERMEQMRIETARRVEEQVRKDREAEARRAACPFGCDPSIKQIPQPTVNYATDDAHQRAMNQLRAQQAEEQRQLDLEAQRSLAEQAKAQAERDTLKRHAEWHDQYVADMQARNRADAAAQQKAERERQRLLTEQRAAAEQRQQAQWQQQVDMTSSLLQGSIRNSEKALATSQNKLQQIAATYSEEDAALAAMLEQAKAAASRK